ncbi:MAG TPA: hypothetical protein ENI85_17240 [Deltaproteobacteria bacterium]|nr:hypothetical protein [Deltaproteobacteria bacterium]
MAFRFAHSRSRAGFQAGIGFVLVLMLALPAMPNPHRRGTYRGQCRQLTRQIEHYETRILPLAIERGNRAWERATNDQVERLWNRRADLCPAYGAERTLLARAADQARRFNKMLAAAGRAAAAFFTGGLAGGLP